MAKGKQHEVGAGLPAMRQPASLPSCHRPGRTGPGPVAARPGREGYPGPFWADGGGGASQSCGRFTEENSPGWRQSTYLFP